MLDSSAHQKGASMFDLRHLRENLDPIREQLGPRGRDVPWDALRKLLEERRALTMRAEQLRADLNKGSEEVARLKRQKQPAEEAVAAMKAVGERIADCEVSLRTVEEELTGITLRIPNVPHASVPIGQSADDNVEVRRWGQPPTVTVPA